MFATKETMLHHSKFHQLDGNPFEPLSTDLFSQQIILAMGAQPAGGSEGWRILTGNATSNLWARVAYRYEIEEDGE